MPKSSEAQGGQSARDPDASPDEGPQWTAEHWTAEQWDVEGRPLTDPYAGGIGPIRRRVDLEPISETAPQTADERIGAAVRALRGDRPQRALADAMRANHGHPWSQTTVWQVESGARPLRLAEAADLAAELGVSVERLLVGGDQAAERGPLQDVLDALAELNAATDHVAQLWAELEKAERAKARAEAVYRLAEAAHDHGPSPLTR